MKRTVEMYRWVEHRESHKHRPDTYHYSKEWSLDDADCDDLRYHNPERIPSLYSKAFHAKHVKVGAYDLSEEQILKMDEYQRCRINKMSPAMEEALPKSLNACVENDYIFIPHRGYGSLSHPEIGCVRIKYDAIYDNTDLALVGVLFGHTFRSYTKNDAEMGDECHCLDNDVEEGPRLRSTNEISPGSHHDAICILHFAPETSNTYISILTQNMELTSVVCVDGVMAFLVLTL